MVTIIKKTHGPLTPNLNSTPKIYAHEGKAYTCLQPKTSKSESSDITRSAKPLPSSGM